MMQIDNNKEKTDRAWDNLYSRLDSEGLLRKEERKHFSSPFVLKWTGAVAAILICIYFSVSYLNRDTNIEMETFLVKQNMEKSTLVTTLEDGSVVYIGENTSLRYPSGFLPDKREVILHGSALFDVMGDKKRPFLIETNEVIIEVLGTAFNVKSLDNKPFELSVQRGKVKVTLKKDGQIVYVHAGETVSLISKDLHLSKNNDSEQFASYAQKMRFKDEPLSNIIRIINLHSPELQLYASNSLGERKLTVTFSNNSVESMAELISLAMNLELNRDGDLITLSE